MRHFKTLDRVSDAELLRELLAAPATPPLVLQAHQVVLYGAGGLGRLALSVLSSLGVSIACVLDRSAGALEYLAPGLKVYRPDDPGLADKMSDRVVLVTTVSAPYGSILRDLNDMGWKTVVPFYDFANQFADRHPLNNGWFAPSLSERDRIAIERVFCGLGDNLSRAHYLQFLAWRLRREDWIFEPVEIVNETRFFISEVCRFLAVTEPVFVDAGAYDGRVFKQLLAITNGRLGNAFLFEPDPESSEALHAFLGTCSQEIRRKTRHFSVALDAQVRQCRFAFGYGMMSRICNQSEMNMHPQPVETAALDDFDLPFNFAKFHLEGGELAALRGAERSIVRQRALVAATVYHNADGLHKTLAYMMDRFPDYAVFFRLHSWCGTGATAYAIPSG